VQEEESRPGGRSPVREGPPGREARGSPPPAWGEREGRRETEGGGRPAQGERRGRGEKRERREERDMRGEG